MKSYCWLTGVGMLCALVAALPAQASLLGVSGDPPTQFGTEHIDQPIMVGTEQDPIEIDIDPSGPDWIKDWMINITETGIATGQVIGVQEHVRMGGGGLVGVPPHVLTDWHQEILDGDFQWGAGSEITVTTTDGSTQTAGGVVSDDGSVVDFFFDPVWPDFDNLVDLVIDKELVYTGPDLPATTGGTNHLQVQVRQNPTPEPGSLMLLGVMGGLLLGRRATR